MNMSVKQSSKGHSSMLTKAEAPDLLNEVPAEMYAGASKGAIAHHYDNGIEFYKLWLGDDLYYTSAKHTDTLTGAVIHPDYAKAQEAKSKFHLDAIGADENASILDIGCGWGTTLRYADRNNRYRSAVGLTLSEEQGDFIRSLGLSNCEVLVQSYEHYTAPKTYDGILTLGALEHFAKPNMSRDEKIAVYRGYFERCHSWLKKGGHLSLQCSTWNGISRNMARRIVPNDVFPESDLAYENEVLEAAEPYFELHYYERSMTDYIMTIKHWHDRLRENRKAITELIGPESFEFHDRYMRRVSAGFKRRRLQLSRFVFRGRA